MAESISFDYSNTRFLVSDEDIADMKERVLEAKQTLLDRSGEGNDFLGWIDLPINYDREEFSRIKAVAKQIQSDSEVLIVIGIGGSYLGARAAIEALGHTFYNVIDKMTRKGAPEIYFCGNNISSTYLEHLLDVVGDRDFSINVISKSGTTTEPAIAFRIFKKLLIEKYGEKKAAKRIYATTDRAKGALKKLADAEGYETFVIPDDVGGRFSVLTAVGLLPIAVSGADIKQLMVGAATARQAYIDSDFEHNDALQYAAIRNILREKGKTMEILANYTPSVHYIGEWWKQLFGESEGKDGKGIYPTACDFTTDLHSLGQFIQDGTKNHIETVINIGSPRRKIIMELEDEDTDGLNYLAGRTVDYINKQAMNGTVLAHVDGEIPNMMITLPYMSEFNLGELFYFFEFACGVSGYVLGVNPFNQPGVESYKKNMFALLGKPGFEEERRALLSRMNKE